MSSGWIIAIIDIVFVLFLGIGFWAGAARGVKRSLLDFGIMIAGVIIVGFITPPITNAILGIKITTASGAMTLEGFFVDFISKAISQGSSVDAGTLLDKAPTLKLFLTKLPSVLLCAVIFLVLNLIMRLVAYLIYKIITVCVFKTKKKEKEKGLKRNRWLGGLIGTFKMFVLVLVIFMPLTSMIKLADRVVPEPVVAAASSEETKKDPLSEALSGMPKEIKLATSSVNRSVFGVLNGAVGLDDFIFDDMSKFSVNGGTVKVRQDLSLYLDLYRDLYNVASSSDLSNVNWNDMDNLYKRATSGALYKNIVLNTVGELVVEYPTLIEFAPNLEQFEPIFTEVKKGLEESENYSQYFGEDVDTVYSIISSLGKSGYLKEVVDNNRDVVDAIVLLATKNEGALLTDSVSKLLDMNILRNAFSPTLDFVLDSVAGGSDNIFGNANTEIADWETFKTQITNIVKKIGEIDAEIKTETLSLSKVISNFKNALLIDGAKVGTVLEKIGGMLDDINKMDIMKDKQDDPLLPQLLEKVGIGDLLSFGNDRLENYAALASELKAPVENLIGLDLYDTIVSENIDINTILKKVATKLVADYNENHTYSEFLTETLIPLYKMNALRSLIFDTVISASGETGVIDFSLLEATKTETSENEEEVQVYDFDASLANWQADLPLLTQIITELERKEFDTETHKTLLDYLLEKQPEEDETNKMNEVIKKLDDELADKVITAILEAKSTKPLKEMLSTEVVKALGDITNGHSITFSLTEDVFSGDEPQTSEIVAIFKQFIKILQETDMGTATLKTIDPTLLGNLMNTIKLNAYRKELSVGSGKPLKVEGITRSMFDAVMATAEAEFGVNLKTLLNKSSYAEIDFMQIFRLAQLANEANEFAEQFKDVVFNDETPITEETLNGLIDKVTEDETIVKEMLDIAKEYDIQVDLDETSVTKENIEQHLESADISPELKEQLKQFLGLGESV